MLPPMPRPSPRGEQRKGRGRGPRGRRSTGWVDPAAVLDALEGFEEPVSPTAVAARLGISDETTREVAAILRSLVEKGDAIELRPGRFATAGHGGEFPVALESGEDGLVARFDADRTAPVHPAHALGASPGDRGLAMVGSDGRALLTRLVERTDRLLVGALNYRGRGLTFVPDKRREGDLPVYGKPDAVLNAYQAGDRVVAEVVGDGARDMGVRLLRILDESSPEVGDFERVRLMHELPDEFPDEVLAAADAAAADFAPAGRRDLRDALIFTIDPETAKDFDDAISLDPLPGGGTRVGVHIADVSHFVDEGGILDAEAANRGTSCYLVNRVIPMLPERLSNGLCSLVPDQDRYTLSVFVDLDRSLNVTAVEPCESLIHSRKRLTYEQAQAILDDAPAAGDFDRDLVKALRSAGNLTRRLRKQRVRKGALNLFSVEKKFELDVDGEPVAIGEEQADEAHHLIEELMLLANRAVAGWLAERDEPCVFRVHGEPDEDRLEFLAEALEGYGIGGFDVTGRAGLQQILRRLEKEPYEARLVLNVMMLRCFQKAYYTLENLGHFALAFPRYCHFTSPIRRYPDLMVHRQVKRVLGVERYRGCESRDTHLEALARRSSYLERRAQEAERDLRSIKAARYLHKRIGDDFAGVVMNPTPGGCFLHLLEVGLDAFLPLRELGDDYFEFDSERQALVGRSSGRVIAVGEHIDVKVIAVDIPSAEVTLGVVGGPPPRRRGRGREIAMEKRRKGKDKGKNKGKRRRR